MSDNQKVINVIRQAIQQETKQGAKITLTPGYIHSASGYYCSAYVREDELVEDVAVPAGAYVGAGDYIVVGQSGTTAWIDRLIPTSMYSKMIHDFNTGRLGFGNGVTEPNDFGSLGQTLLSGGPYASAYWGSQGGHVLQDHTWSGNLIPATDSAYNVGSDAVRVKTGFFDTVNTALLENGGSSMSVGDNFHPDADATHKLGWASARWDYIFTTRHYVMEDNSAGPLYLRRSGVSVANNDELGRIEWQGYDGSSEGQDGARMSALATENWSGTNRGTELIWYTTAAGWPDPAGRMALDETALAPYTNGGLDFGKTATRWGTGYFDALDIADTSWPTVELRNTDDPPTSGADGADITFCGYDGSSDIIGARIRSVINGTIGTGRMPTELRIATMPDEASPTLTDRWVFDEDGTFRPYADSTYNIGSNSIRVATGYFDTVYVPSYGCHVYRSSNYNTSTGTWYYVGFGQEGWDSNSLHDTSTNNDRVILNREGRWLIIGQAAWDGASGGNRRATLQIDGTTTIAKERTDVIGSAVEVCLNMSRVYVTTGTTAYVRLGTYQSSGGSVNLLSASTFLTAIWLGE